MTANKNNKNQLLERTIEEFIQVSTLIGTTDDDVYTHGSESDGSIGAHIRHNFDLASNFLIGLKTGEIDYTRRERDFLIEQKRQFAIEQIGEMIESFRRLPVEPLEKRVRVRSEVDETVWHASSAMRELEFLHSHTVHHHAMVAEKLKALGVEVPAGFGVAPSTLKFWAERDRKLAAEHVCP